MYVCTYVCIYIYIYLFAVNLKAAADPEGTQGVPRNGGR